MSIISVVVFLLLPIILSGYVLYDTMLLRRYWVRRKEGISYFRILLTGYIWVWLMERLIYLGTAEDWPTHLFVWFLPEREYKYGIVAMGIAVMVRWFLDSIYVCAQYLSANKKLNYQKAILRGQDMSLFLHFHMTEYKPILITLKEDKIYMGIILDVDIENDISWLRISPLKSGYQDNKKNKHWTIYIDRNTFTHHYPQEPSVLISAEEISLMQPAGIDLRQALGEIYSAHENKPQGIKISKCP